MLKQCLSDVETLDGNSIKIEFSNNEAMNKTFPLIYIFPLAFFPVSSESTLIFQETYVKIIWYLNIIAPLVNLGGISSETVCIFFNYFCLEIRYALKIFNFLISLRTYSIFLLPWYWDADNTYYRFQCLITYVFD